MTADRAFDSGSHERREGDAAARVKTGGRPDQPNRTGLDQVIELLSAARIPARDRTHEREVRAHQVLPRSIRKTRTARVLRRRFPAPEMSLFTDLGFPLLRPIPP